MRAGFLMTLALLAPGIAGAQFVRLKSYVAATRCAEVEEGSDQQLEIMRNLPLRVLYVSKCVAEGQVERLRRFVNVTDALKAKNPDVARAWIPVEIGLLKQSGIMVTALFGSADMVGLPTPPADQSLKGQIAGWDALSRQNLALTEPATAHLAETSFEYCSEVTAELNSVRERNTFELLALASMLFVCDRPRFRQVDWQGIMDRQPRAAFELKRLLALDAMGLSEGIDYAPTSLIFFSYFVH